MTRYWEAEPRSDISSPPSGNVLWHVHHIETKESRVDVSAPSAWEAARKCGWTLSQCRIRPANCHSCEFTDVGRRCPSCLRKKET